MIPTWLVDLCTFVGAASLGLCGCVVVACFIGGAYRRVRAWLAQRRLVAGAKRIVREAAGKGAS